MRIEEFKVSPFLLNAISSGTTEVMNDMTVLLIHIKSENEAISTVDLFERN